MDICSRFISLEEINNAFLLHTDSADIKICFVTDEIVRIWTSFDKKFTDESYVLMTTAWEDRLDFLFEGERKRIAPIKLNFTETDASLRFTTDKIYLLVEKNPLNFSLFSSDDTLLYSTIAGNPFVRSSNGKVTAYSHMDEDDCYYGFGERTGLINKNSTFIRERATDCMGYDAKNADTLYKHIPFYIRLDRSTKKAAGVFYNNFYESVFNMGCEKSNYWSRYTYWQADGGDIDLFLFGGGSMARVIDNYTLLTGRPTLLPKRALGYQGSSMYYSELPKDSDDAVLDFVDTVKSENFPIDGFHLSSGYTSQDNKRCVFTWNTTRFKNPAKFFKTMKSKHVQAVPNVKPGILLSHPLFKEFDKACAFIKSSKNPSENAVGKWWGGDGAFWDFTNPKARAAWKKHLTESIISTGTDSVWNDNCEYDGLLDTDSVCDFDGASGTVAQLKPIMSNLMSKLGAEAVTEHDKNARPYIVCRSGSAGIQHFAQTWCGDNYTSWETLKYNIPTITGMGLSGQPNEGADIGGFAGPAPDEELFVRWVQQGIFQPRFSIHSASNDNTVTEPWMYTASADLIRQAILLRYRFAPYLYSAEYMAAQTGAPIMRALVYDFQDDINTYDESFTYMFGRDLLVANVLEPGASSKSIYLPAGCKWYDWNDNYKVYEGGQTVEVPVDISTIPMFVREGAVITMAKNQLMSMEADHVTALRLIVAPVTNVPGAEEMASNTAVSSEACTETILYDDDGTTNDFKSGVYRKTTITATPALPRNNNCMSLHFKSEGSYTDYIKTIHAQIISKEKAPIGVFLGGHKLQHFLHRSKFNEAAEGWYYSQTKRTVEVKYSNPGDEYTLTVSFDHFDLIGM